MPIGQDAGDSGNTPLTVDSAAARIEALLSQEETQETETESKTPATQDTPETEETPVEEAETPDDESVEADDSETEQEQSEETDEESGEEQSEAPKTIKVKINGQDVEVPIDEAAAGYSRNKDYTQKTQQLAEERKAFLAEQTAIRAERQQIRDALTRYESQLQAVGGEPDWEKLLAEDPQSFASTHAAWQIHQSKLAAAQQERARVEQQMQTDSEAQYNALVEAEAAKLEAALPEWKNPEVAKKERTDLRAYANELGYTDKQLSEVGDHRVILLLRKAMLFDQAATQKVAAAKKAAPKIEKVKTATPGPAKGSKREVSEFAKRSQRLRTSHSVNDAASLIELMLPD